MIKKLLGSYEKQDTVKKSMVFDGDEVDKYVREAPDSEIENKVIFIIPAE